MVAIPTRHRSLRLLAGVLVAQALLLAIQIKGERQARLIRVWAVGVVSPIQRAGAWTIDHLHAGWTNYVALRHTGEENARLRAELEQLKLRNAELAGRAAEADRLAALLGFRQAHAEVPMLPARVIGSSADAGRIIYINRGEKEGVRRNMGVITPDGVVGKVIEVYSHTSQVLLIDGKESGVGALLADTRTQGPVVGDPGKPWLLMEFITNDEKVYPGERVLTSGQDRIFPKDLPVGTVVDVKRDPHAPFQTIHVAAAAHLDRLEEVIVLLTRQELAPPKEAGQGTATVGAGKAAARPQ